MDQTLSESYNKNYCFWKFEYMNEEINIIAGKKQRRIANNLPFLTVVI